MTLLSHPVSINNSNRTVPKNKSEGQEFWKSIENKNEPINANANFNQFCPTPKWGLKIYQIMSKCNSPSVNIFSGSSHNSSSLSSLGGRPSSLKNGGIGSLRNRRPSLPSNNIKQLPFWYGNEDEDQLKLHINQYWQQIKKQDKETNKAPQRPKRFIGKVERTLPKIVYRDNKSSSKQRVKLLLTTDEIHIYESVTRPSWNPFMPEVKKMLLRSEWNFETGVLERCKLLGIVDFSSFTPKKKRLQQSADYQDALYNLQQDCFSSATPPTSSLIFTPSSKTPLKPHNSNSQNSYIYCMPVQQEELDCMHDDPNKYVYFVCAENLDVGFTNPGSSAETTANSAKIIRSSSLFIGDKPFCFEEKEAPLNELSDKHKHSRCLEDGELEDDLEDSDDSEEDQEEEEEEDDYYEDDEDDDFSYVESSTFITTCSTKNGIFSCMSTNTASVNKNPFSRHAFNNAVDEDGSGDIFEFEDDTSSGCSPISPPISSSPKSAGMGIAIPKNNSKKFFSI